MNTKIAQGANAARYRLPLRPVLRRLFLALLIALPSGFPLALLYVPEYVSIQLQIVLIAGLLFLRVFQLVNGSSKMRLSELAMCLVVAYFFLVSFISNTFLLPEELDSWLPGLPSALPLLTLLAFNALKVSVKEVLDALLIACAFAAGIVLMDQIAPISAIDVYLHVSSQSGSDRRIVILHNHMAFAFVIALARLFASDTNKMRAVWVGVLALVSFSMFVVAESRLVIGAALVGSMFYLFFIYRSRIKPFVLVITVVIAGLLSPLVLGKYIEYAASMSVLSEDASVRFRNYEIGHFENFYNQTGGVGFGLMSLSPNKQNILSEAAYKAGELYGAPGYQVSLVDIRLYAALYQYGWIGLLIVLSLTGLVIWHLWRASRVENYEHRDAMGAMAGVTLGFMLSPLPINLFTVDNTIGLGGVLIFVAAQAYRDTKALRFSAALPLVQQKRALA